MTNVTDHVARVRGSRASLIEVTLVSTVGTELGAFIGGQWVEGDGEEIVVLNPATGDAIGSIVSSSEAQVGQAVQAATQAFQSWRKRAPLERVELCRHAFSLCEERLEE